MDPSGTLAPGSAAMQPSGAHVPDTSSLSLVAPSAAAHHQSGAAGHAPAAPQGIAGCVGDHDDGALLTSWSELLDVFRAHISARLGQVDLACLALSSKRMAVLVWQELPEAWHELDMEAINRQLHLLRPAGAASSSGMGAAGLPSRRAGDSIDYKMTAAATALILRKAAAHVRSLRVVEVNSSAAAVLEAAAAAAPGLESLCIRTKDTHAPMGLAMWQRVKAALASAACTRLACLDLDSIVVCTSFADLCAAVLGMGCCAGLRELRLPQALGNQGLADPHALSPMARRESLRELLRLLCALGRGLEVLQLPQVVDVTDGVLMLLMAHFPRLYDLEGGCHRTPAPLPLAEWPVAVLQEAGARQMHTSELMCFTQAAQERMWAHEHAAASALRAQQADGGGKQVAKVAVSVLRI